MAGDQENEGESEVPLARKKAEVLLRRLEAGDGSARAELFELLYGDLRTRAHRLMVNSKSGETLQPTILVHEAFLKLTASASGSSYSDASHFLSVAALAMRQVVLDHLRSKDNGKRRAVGDRVCLDGVVAFDTTAEFDLEYLIEAIEELSQIDGPMARAVELRVFSGCDSADAAKAINVPLRTFQRRWASTVEWLRQRVAGQDT